MAYIAERLPHSYHHCTRLPAAPACASWKLSFTLQPAVTWLTACTMAEEPIRLYAWLLITTICAVPVEALGASTSAPPPSDAVPFVAFTTVHRVASIAVWSKRSVRVAIAALVWLN